MAKTIAQIRQQLAKLQRQADAVRKKEVRDAVSRIRALISEYNLTPADIFGTRAGAIAPSIAKRTEKGTQKQRKLARVKYRDAAGNTWSGRGRTPAWLSAEIAAGRSKDDFLVKALET